MPHLLLELFSEEIPARMQRRAAQDLQKMITDGLVEAGLNYEGAKAFWTPRRLTLSVNGLTTRSADIREERKGPRVDAPEKAIAGFLRGAGLSSVEEATIKNDPKKGDFYVAIIEKPGRAAEEILQTIIPETIKKFPWPKSMRWGKASSETGALRWVRPLQSILCLYGPETEETEIIPFEVSGIKSGKTTYGHRFHAPDAFSVRRLDDYMSKLEKANVVLDAERRKDIILHDAKDLALANGLELIEDNALLEEVSGLVEWPVVLMGSFDEDFLSIPPEVIKLTIRENQKCFVLKDAATGKLTNRFIMISNLAASDDGEEIIHGNEKVVRARLADAKFFWENDLNTPLDKQVDKLKIVTFHEKLGTQFDRVERLKNVAAILAPLTGADETHLARAAQLCKADLMTEMVYEFGELQGLMGRYYAMKSGEHASVSVAMEDHYKPQGPSDSVPTDKVAATLALADKLDTLSGFWAINEKPTGSKDPYALRRAALGVIRIILENDIRIHLLSLKTPSEELVTADLLSFFHDRLKVYLRDKGARYDLIDAVLTPQSDDLLMIARRIEALTVFIVSDEGQDLLAGHRRASNILEAEIKKGAMPSQNVSDAYLSLPEEKALSAAITAAAKEAKTLVEKEDFAAALSSLSALRAPLDAFFDKVLVNDENKDIRENRLALLQHMTETTALLADFSHIER